jgi:hypothetical protein
MTPFALALIGHNATMHPNFAWKIQSPKPVADAPAGSINSLFRRAANNRLLVFVPPHYLGLLKKPWRNYPFTKVSF